MPSRTPRPISLTPSSAAAIAVGTMWVGSLFPDHLRRERAEKGKHDEVNIPDGNLLRVHFTRDLPSNPRAAPKSPLTPSLCTCAGIGRPGKLRVCGERERGKKGEVEGGKRTRVKCLTLCHCR